MNVDMDTDSALSHFRGIVLHPFIVTYGLWKINAALIRNFRMAEIIQKIRIIGIYRT